MQKKITIFIHGTFPVGTQTLPLIHTFFFCPPGLTRAQELDPKLHLSKVAELLAKEAPVEYSAEDFYFFGWSGKLSFQARKEAAQELAACIHQLISIYKADSHEPILRLITHSHGGNVALYLREYITDQSLNIEELILLAIPVQIETAAYAKEPLFSSIYSFYSQKDLLQVLDPQGIHSFLESLKQYGLEFTVSHLKDLGPLFSERRFDDAPHIKQLHVTYPHREFLHIEFLLPPFIQALPNLTTQMKTASSTPQTHIFKN